MAKDKSGLKGERESVSSMSQSKTHRSQCPQEKWRVNSLTLIRPWSLDNYKTLMAEFWQRWSPIERLNTSKVSCKPINAFGSRMVKITHMGIYFHGEKEFVYVDDQLNFTFFVYKNSCSRNVVSETRIPKPAFLPNTEISLNNADGIMKSWIWQEGRGYIHGIQTSLSILFAVNFIFQISEMLS